VYLAIDEVLNREVALKVLTHVTSHTDVQEALLAEARALAAVAHPNIAGVLDVLRLPLVDVLVLEYVAGGSLADALDNSRPLERSQILHLLAGAAAGLGAIHKAGLLHCDLKPENILVDGDGRARIADFGLARLEQQLVTHSSGGSLGYAAPEVMMGEPATAASDWYAFGVIAWELFAGRRAFGATRTLETLTHKLRSALAPLSEVASDMPAEVRHVIAQCLSVAPEARPSSATRVVEVFRPYLAGTSHESVRHLRGVVFIGVIPTLAMVTLIVLVAKLWIAPELHGLLGGLSWDRLLRKAALKGAEVLLAAIAGLIAVIAWAIRSATNIVRQRMRSGAESVSFWYVMREAFGPPRWWPTWYPGVGTPPIVRAMPPTINKFRLFTWWGVPIVSFVSIVVVLFSLASEPMVSAAVARWSVVAWLLTICISGVWLVSILHEFKHSVVYDTFELAAVALFRVPVDDRAKAFPPPVPEVVVVPYSDRWWRRN